MFYHNNTITEISGEIVHQHSLGTNSCCFVQMTYRIRGKYIIVTDRGLGFQVSYGPSPCSRKTERAKRARSSCCTDQVRN